MIILWKFDLFDRLVLKNWSEIRVAWIITKEMPATLYLGDASKWDYWSELK